MYYKLSRVRTSLFITLTLAGILGCSLTDKITAKQSPAAMSTPPGICSNLSQVTPSAAFTLNKDYKRRDKIVGMNVEWGKDDSGGLIRLNRLSLSVVAQLYEEKFIDPNDRQNLAPTAQEILAFMCRHPSALASGYMISPERDDYRVTIETVELPTKDATPAARQEFETLCKNANELDIQGDFLYCWWD